MDDLAAGTALQERDVEEFSPREQEILEVCGGLLTEIGYERLTIDAVAARAKASKATIYRRWPGKPALVGAAVRHLTDTAHMAPDYTGDLRADLLKLLTNARDRFLRQGPLMAGMINAMQSDPELAALLRADIARCKANVDDLLDRYGDSGEITAVDPDLIRQLAPATLILRILVTDEPVDDELLASLVDHVMVPLLAPGRRL